MSYLGKASSVPLELSPGRKEDPTMRISGRKLLKVKGTGRGAHPVGWERTLHFEEKARRTTARAERWERGPTVLKR